GCDDDDDDELSWAGEGRSVLRCWGRLRHSRFDAELCLCGGISEELRHGGFFFFKAGGAVFLQGFWENVAADCGFLVVKSWWIVGEWWSENGLKSGARNMPRFTELFSKVPFLGDGYGRSLAVPVVRGIGQERTRQV